MRTAADSEYNDREGFAMSDLSLSQKGIDLLKAVERLRLQTYDDQTGEDISSWVEGATIGYGHLIARNEWELYKNGIIEAQAEALFADDLAPFVRAVNRGVTADIEQHEFDACVILAFNIGVSGFSDSSALKLINDPSATTNYDSLENAWKAWNKTQGKVSQGLANRRNAEWKIYSQAIYERW
jgi:GH24 family phage-related lysozyme (muramidase)